MATVIGIINQEPGTGKTALAVNTAAALALCEKKTLLVDSDPAGTATGRMIGGEYPPARGLDRIFLDRRLSVELFYRPVHETLVDYLEIIPAGPDLSGVETVLSDTPDREEILRDVLQTMPGEVELVVIDAPSSLDFHTTAVITAADLLVIPVACRAASIAPLHRLLAEVQRIRRQNNPGLKIAGVVFTHCPDKEAAAATIPADVLAGLRPVLMDVTIAGEGADSGGQDAPVIVRDVLSAAAEPYLDLAALLIEKSNTGQTKGGQAR
ncbi:MAG: ParA family protein [Desulfosudaceae bacterium]